MQAAYDAGLVVQTEPGRVPRYKRYLDEQRGKPISDVWEDIPPINSRAIERLGYPTQKPLALLERIIQASSNEGDVVLDPFCVTGDTGIVTRDGGLRPIAEVAVGDYVLTHRGRWRPVTRCFRRVYQGEMLTLQRAKSNVGLQITPNHPVLAVRAQPCPYDDRRCLPRPCRYHRSNKHLDCSNPKRAYSLEWVEAGQLQEGDWVYFPQFQATEGEPAPAFLPIAQTGHFNAKPLPKVVAVTPELMEWIGYFAAEGFVDANTVHFTNYEDAERIAELGCRLFGLAARIENLPYRCKHIRFGSRALSAFMENLVGRGAATKHLPSWVFALAPTCRRGLLRGMFRGDGSFRQDKQDDLSHSYRYSSASPNLAHALYRLLLAEGVVCGYQVCQLSRKDRIINGRPARVNHPAHQVCVYDVTSVNKLLAATQEAPGYADTMTRMPYDTYPFEGGWLYTLRGIKRQAEAETEVFNIEVEEDHSYVTATMAVHNCGCGTAIIAAQKLNRRWLGIDVTPIATSLVQKRLFDTFQAKNVRLLSKDDPGLARAFAVEGLPTDLAGARLLYDKDPTHKDFEMWAVGLVPAIPQEKKGADQGIDGVAYFQDNAKAPSKAVVQVKGGHVTANQMRDLRGVMAREKAQLGFFLCLESPTQPMQNEALAAGFYQPPSGVGRRVPALQIRTIEQLLHGNAFDFPLFGSNVSFKQAQAAAQAGQSQMEM